MSSNLISHITFLLTLITRKTYYLKMLFFIILINFIGEILTVMSK